MRTNLHLAVLAIAVAAMGLSSSARADEMTAFQLVKKGNEYVGPDVRDQVVQIRSEKSVGGMFPTIWYIVYYDPDAAFRATEVKFGGGKKLEVKRPTRMIEFTNKDKDPLDRKKLNVDSDKALAIAEKDPLLDKLTLKASEMKLERSDEGPVWKIRLWAAKLRNPNDDANLGEVWVLADDGRVMKRDLHPDHVD